MEKRSRSLYVIPAIAAVLIAVLLLDTWQVFRMTSQLTLDSGRYQLETISGELERTIGDAEQLAMQLAISAQPLLSDRPALRN